MRARHVVFGAGQIGRPLVEHLLALGQDVVSVNRSGRTVVPAARTIGGDATDPAFTRSVCAGADVVYFCLNAANYGRWPVEFPPLQRGVLLGAESAGARLVVLDNLYAYGPALGGDLVEGQAQRPTSAKAATRAAMTDELLRAHAEDRVEIAVGRASDFFGPGVTESALGEGVFGRIVDGRTAQVMGDPDQLHSYSYAPDVAAALAVLGTRPEAAGRIWHLPVAPAWTTRRIVVQACLLARRRPRLFAAGRLGLTLAGVANPGLRELRNTLYQFTERWVVDDGAFRATFGGTSTPLEDAIAASVRWFADRRAHAASAA